MGLLFIFYPQIYSVDDRDRAESLFDPLPEFVI